MRGLDAGQHLAVSTERAALLTHTGSAVPPEYFRCQTIDERSGSLCAFEASMSPRGPTTERADSGPGPRPASRKRHPCSRLSRHDRFKRDTVLAGAGRERSCHLTSPPARARERRKMAQFCLMVACPHLIVSVLSAASAQVSSLDPVAHGLPKVVRAERSSASTCPWARSATCKSRAPEGAGHPPTRSGRVWGVRGGESVGRRK